MASRRLKLSNKQEAGFSVYEIDTNGNISISVIEIELVEVSSRNQLPPTGGLFSVAMAAATVEGDSIASAGSQLGGIKIQDDKKETVLSEVRALGYEIQG
jgi:hypothetical protein